ncbi:hypothetical protein KBP46_09920 [Chryseobacterium sp. PCH239]|uniref:hypothetical protein n=1 Tax=Chryseobacterium sp. PCH239 TaxID=2825845 RepID=UPI001C10AB53|nr:hypothetical protein [Chryseobacterium sp. PCH239]QWT88112.1 hypothetical protein KBP46_09920 [Chryseobacterium sp. PCH239]
MEQNTNVNSTKKSGCLKWALIITGSFVFLLFAMYKCGSNIIESDKEKQKADSLKIASSQQRKKALEKGWSNLTSDQRKTEIDNFIKSKDDFYSEKRFLLNNDINSLIKYSVKYPETLEFRSIGGDLTKNPDGNTSISENDISKINYEKGEFYVMKDFVSENKLSMKVKGLIIVLVSFDGLKYKIKDVKFE